MNTRNFTAVIALSSVLPLAAWSQSSGSGTSGSGSSGSSSTSPSSTSSSDADRTTGSASGSSSSNNSPTSGTGSSTSAGGTGSSYGSGSGAGSTGSASAAGSSGTTGSTYGTSGSSASGLGTGSSLGASNGIHRVSQHGLDSRLTASSLIGKKVVDQNGKDVGTVKDIGLNSVLPRDLRMAANESSSSGQTGASRVGEEIGNFGQRATGNVNVYVSVGGVFGIGSDVIAVPASQLKREGDNLKIQMTQDQLKAIASNSQADTYNSASE